MMRKEIQVIKKDDQKIIYLITDQNEKIIEKILPLEAKSLYVALRMWAGILGDLSQR